MRGEYTELYLSKLQEWRNFNSDKWVELMQKYPELGKDVFEAQKERDVEKREMKALELYEEAKSVVISDPDKSALLYRRSRIWNLESYLSNLIYAIRDAQEHGVRLFRRE